MIRQIPFIAIFGFFIAEFGHAFNTFDSVHFFPARRSYYAGDGFYERKWMSCVQELQELKLQGMQQAQNYGYHSTAAPYGGSGERAQQAKKAAKDSYEIIYPPNYKPAYKYEKLRIADVIYPLKLRQAYHPYQVPTYPRQQSGGYGTTVENNNGNYAINGNNDNKPEEEGYGHAENGGKSEEYNGYRKEVPEEQQPNYNSANENSGNDEKEVPPPDYKPEEKTPTPYIQPAGAPPEVADNNYEQEMPEKEQIPEKSTHENYGDGKEENDGHGHSEEEGANDVNAEMQQHFDHQSDEPYGSAAEEEEAEAEEEAENFGSEQQSDENNWEEEENENDEGYGQEDDDDDGGDQYSKEQQGDGEHMADNGAPEESNPPQSVGDQTNQGSAGILPAANGGQPQSAAITDPQQQQQQQMAEQQQQQSMPKQNEEAQTGGDGQPQNTTTPTTTAPATQSTTSTSTTQNSNIACRMEPIEQCSARARCMGESQQTSLDCTTMGDDMIFDTVTQDCKSILGVPECAKEQFCVGKTLGWTLVGGQCAKVSYLCGLAQESDQQSTKLICTGSEVVNPEMPGQCIVRTMVAGC